MKGLLRTITILTACLFAPIPMFSAEEQTDPEAEPIELETVFTQAELDQLLAPIALYPDVLLSQILIASTYPLEVVSAARWSQANAGLEGEDALEAVEEFDWDPSVKALAAFPDVLARMNEDLDWLQRLGDAVLVQEDQIMQTIQDLRGKAYAAGTFDAMENVRVIREPGYIIIEPMQPEVVYVPYYSPYAVYGSWWWADYPPYYWGPDFLLHYSYPTFHWSIGFRFHWGFFYGGCDWPRHRIVVRPHHPRPGPGRIGPSHRGPDRFIPWRHDPGHRGGVRYPNPDLNRRFRPPRDPGLADLRSGTIRPGHLQRGDILENQSSQDRRDRTPPTTVTRPRRPPRRPTTTASPAPTTPRPTPSRTVTPSSRSTSSPTPSTSRSSSTYTSGGRSYGSSGRSSSSGSSHRSSGSGGSSSSGRSGSSGQSRKR